MLIPQITGRRSLEHRLRDATQLKAETNSLLASLSKALNNGRSNMILDQVTKLSNLSNLHRQRTSSSMGRRNLFRFGL